jgi:hypothetical protein
MRNAAALDTLISDQTNSKSAEGVFGSAVRVPKAYRYSTPNVLDSSRLLSLGSGWHCSSNPGRAARSERSTVNDLSTAWHQMVKRLPIRRKQEVRRERLVSVASPMLRHS